MNAHPTKGASIIAPVTKLAPVVPLIRITTSGSTDRGTRIASWAWRSRSSRGSWSVADAFEAMTDERPYRMTPLTPEEALAELRRYAGIQFDPEMVEAFARTDWVRGVADPDVPTSSAPVPTHPRRRRSDDRGSRGRRSRGRTPAENA